MRSSKSCHAWGVHWLPGDPAGTGLWDHKIYFQSKSKVRSRKAQLSPSRIPKWQRGTNTPLQAHSFLGCLQIPGLKLNLLLSLGGYCNIIFLLSFTEIKMAFLEGDIYIRCRQRGKIHLTYVVSNILKIMFPFCLIYCNIFSPSHL